MEKDANDFVDSLSELPKKQAHLTLKSPKVNGPDRAAAMLKCVAGCISASYRGYVILPNSKSGKDFFKIL